MTANQLASTNQPIPTNSPPTKERSLVKHIVLIAAFVSLLLSPAAAFGQTPPPAQPTYDPYSLSTLVRPAPRCGWWEFWCSDAVYRNPNVSPVIKRKLYEHDPRVCHCDVCRRMRLAAGVEYDGLDRSYPRPVPTPPPSIVSKFAPKPKPVDTPSFKVDRLVWCSATSRIVNESDCPK